MGKTETVPGRKKKIYYLYNICELCVERRMKDREMKKHNQRYWREKRLKEKIARDCLNWKRILEAILLNMKTKIDTGN